MDTLIVVAIVTGVSSFLVNVFSTLQKKKIEKEVFLIDKTYESYIDLFDLYNEILNDKADQNEIAERMAKIRINIILFGSKKLITHMLSFGRR